MKLLLMKYSERGAMTLEEFAAVINQKPAWLRRNSSEPGDQKPKLYERMRGKPIRFDPTRQIEILYPSDVQARHSSLTIEGHKTSAKKPINGGFAKCL
jgi:hypothetical protein